MGETRVGIAGWVYEPWRGTFYPPELKQKEELAYASAALGAIEINATFYSTQKPASFANWAGQTPADFKFSLKGPKFITDSLKLKGAEQALADFFASGPLRLGTKLGPVIWALPAAIKFDPPLLEEFFSRLPRSAEQAVALAARHSARIKEPYLDASAVGPVRHAIEVTGSSYLDPEFPALLRRYNVALVHADTVGWPYADVTADFVYARLRGPARTGAEGYTPTDIDVLAERIVSWRSGTRPRDIAFIDPEHNPTPVNTVFAFFVNTDKIHAPHNAQALQRRLNARAEVLAD